MTLAQLRTKLNVLTGTSIGEVFFDWKLYLNEVRSKTYPVVLWQLDGAKVKKDIRTTPTQPVKTLTLQVYIIQNFDGTTEDKVTVWDQIEGWLDIYLNKMHVTDKIAIDNINELNGTYYGEGLLSADSEIGMSYEVTLKMWC